MTNKIIIDTDPGQDDAIALLLAAASPELALLGVTTVAGNVPLPLTTRNARTVLELAGRRDVPVCAGAAARWTCPWSPPSTCTARQGLTASSCRAQPAARPAPCGRLHRADPA